MPGFKIWNQFLGFDFRWKYQPLPTTLLISPSRIFFNISGKQDTFSADATEPIFQTDSLKYSNFLLVYSANFRFSLEDSEFPLESSVNLGVSWMSHYDVIQLHSDWSAR